VTGFSQIIIRINKGGLSQRKSSEHRMFLAMNPEHKGDSTSFSNPVVTRADFTYSMRLNRIKIVDLSTGKASVSSDIESVLRKIERVRHGRKTNGFVITSPGELNPVHFVRPGAVAAQP
jgi:hypothetical protein